MYLKREGQFLLPIVLGVIAGGLDQSLLVIVEVPLLNRRRRKRQTREKTRGSVRSSGSVTLEDIEVVDQEITVGDAPKGLSC